MADLVFVSDSKNNFIIMESFLIYVYEERERERERERGFHFGFILKKD